MKILQALNMPKSSEEKMEWEQIKRVKEQRTYRQMPNIAIIIPPSVGGIIGEVFLANIINLLEPLSKKIYVIATIKPTNIVKQETYWIWISGYKEKEPLLVKLSKFLFITQLKASFQLFKIYKEVDIVIFHIGCGAYLLPLIIAKLLGKKTIFCATGLYSAIGASKYKGIAFGLGGIISSFSFKILEKITFYIADQIAVESEIAVESLALSKYREKISIFGALYMDKNFFAIEKKLESRENLIGYIGRLSEEKGVMNFVKAIPLVLKERDDPEFLIGGDGPLFDEIKNKLKNDDSYDKVRITGWITYDEIPKYLTELKIVVLPSYTEGLSGIVQEAMACGTPVLATPVGGIPDLIKDGKTGFIMENNSPECIAENVIRVLEHQNLEEIVKNARKLVEDEYSYEVMVRKCRDSLNELMKVNRRIPMK